jgi:hypothetical protein
MGFSGLVGTMRSLLNRSKEVVMDDKRVEQPVGIGTTRDEQRESLQAGRQEGIPPQTERAAEPRERAEPHATDEAVLKPQRPTGPAEEPLEECEAPPLESQPGAEAEEGPAAAEEIRAKIEEAQRDLEQDFREFDRFEGLFKSCFEVSREFGQAVESFTSQADELVATNNVLETE